MKYLVKCIRKSGDWEWWVFKRLTVSISLPFEKCDDQLAAEELAKTLNDDATPQPKP